MKNMNIVISADTLPALQKFSDSGQIIDGMARSVDCWDSLEMEENNLEWRDECMAYAVNQFDYEQAALDLCNSAGNKRKRAIVAMLQLDIASLDRARILKGWAKSDLLLGAYIALEHGDLWQHGVSFYTDAQKELAYQHYDEPAALNADLKADMLAAEARYSDDLYSTWLRGDRNDGGVLDKIQQNCKASDVEYDRKTDVLTLEYDADAVADVIEARQYDDEDQAKYDKLNDTERGALVRSIILEDILSDAEHYTENAKAENAKRRAENEKTRVYKAERAAAEAEAERVKLLAMKREGKVVV